MTQLNHLRVEYWAIEVPEETTGYRIEYIPEIDICELILYKVSTDPDFFDELDEFKNIDLPLGTWQIVCLSSNCSEENAIPIVGEKISGGFAGHIYGYYDYGLIGCDIQPLSTAIKSLHSLLRSRGLNGPNYIILKKQP